MKKIHQKFDVFYWFWVSQQCALVPRLCKSQQNPGALCLIVHLQLTPLAVTINLIFLYKIEKYQVYGNC